MIKKKKCRANEMTVIVKEQANDFKPVQIDGNYV